MRVIITFESMYGSTHQVADAIGAGFGGTDEVSVVPVHALDSSAVSADLLVIGMPTHAHGLPGPESRRVAITSAQIPDGDHDVEPFAGAPGVREWLASSTDQLTALVATFDTRFRLPAWMSGHPARRVGIELRRRGATLLAPAQSFYVDRQERLKPGQLERARQWGERLSSLAHAADVDAVRR